MDELMADLEKNEAKIAEEEAEEQEEEEEEEEPMIKAEEIDTELPTKSPLEQLMNLPKEEEELSESDRSEKDEIDLKRLSQLSKRKRSGVVQKISKKNQKIKL